MQHDLRPVCSVGNDQILFPGKKASDDADRHSGYGVTGHRRSIYILVFGKQSPLYSVLDKAGIQIVFAVPGIILATIFVTFPFVSREIIPVLESIGSDEEEAAALMGSKRLGRSLPK